MEKSDIEKMVVQVIKFLQKKKMWDSNTGIYANGLYYQNDKIENSDRKYPGVALIWFEGPLNHALNHGLRDPNYTIYKALESIMNRYGCYPVFGSHCDFNIYEE